MKDLYEHCQITKQGHYQMLQREAQWAIKERFYVGFMLEIREIHPAMGLRTMYEYYLPPGIGRDAFIEIGIFYGLRVKTFKNFARTTFSSPFSRYKNLLVNKVLTDIDQLWTSDLTYFKVGEKFYYIVLIMDVYSRLIVGYSVADNMRAENNIAALTMALTTRKKKNYYHQLIHHSDRGGQYVSDDYTQMLTDANIRISMCNEVYENAHIERVNGTIKNQYLIHRNITNFQELTIELKRTIKTYNVNKPHKSIKGMSPFDFEQQVKNIPDEKRLKLPIWTCDYSKVNDPNQCILQF
jgi:putative transposase